ncbi:ribonuclease HII [Corynebacterium epidermidicanis]|uniref:Ribonuclease HII n=1 Tax=Corynebacterium epidermidicanis TaxID=1050174 RepID=A0A0G3GV63_9CORY|nr:ribonuclease HII [Corynebacterium epidermidicanis]AKK03423.1 RNase HII [Corynebacterium epidermidicanis]
MRKLKQLRTYEVGLSKAGLGPVAGVDEAGRGACAGPIVIAACILPDRTIPALDQLQDSKKLSPARRAQLFPLIKKYAVSWSIVEFSAAEIDTLGIQYSNIAGMRRAIAGLDQQPSYVLIDGFAVPGLTVPSLPIVGGDDAARCIAAASVLAKHHRDEVMAFMDARWPDYGFAAHKGYGTKVHMDAVRRHGGSAIHRYSYANVAAAHGQWLVDKGQR